MTEFRILAQDDASGSLTHCSRRQLGIKSAVAYRGGRLRNGIDVSATEIRV